MASGATHWNSIDRSWSLDTIRVMLTLHTGHTRDCSGLARRDFVQAGVLALGGLCLPQLLAAKEAARKSGKGYVRDRQVVLLFLGGGASHIETFNPNLDAPVPYSSVTSEVKTAIPGLSLGGTFPQLAEHAKRLAGVRSVTHDNGHHPTAIIHLLTSGADPRGDGNQGYSMGSIFARIRGASDDATGLPTNCLL